MSNCINMRDMSMAAGGAGERGLKPHGREKWGSRGAEGQTERERDREREAGGGEGHTVDLDE